MVQQLPDKLMALLNAGKAAGELQQLGRACDRRWCETLNPSKVGLRLCPTTMHAAVARASSIAIMQLSAPLLEECLAIDPVQHQLADVPVDWPVH